MRYSETLKLTRLPVHACHDDKLPQVRHQHETIFGDVLLDLFAVCGFAGVHIRRFYLDYTPRRNETLCQWIVVGRLLIRGNQGPVRNTGSDVVCVNDAADARFQGLSEAVEQVRNIRIVRGLFDASAAQLRVADIRKERFDRVVFRQEPIITRADRPAPRPRLTKVYPENSSADVFKEEGQLRSASFPYIAPLLFLSVPIAHAQDDDANRQILFDGQVQVPPTKRYEVRFATHSNFKNARIAGNVQAQGGTGNDIRVLVIKGQSLVYDSGRRRSVVMSVDCSEPGQYVLLFDNTFSIVSPKVVSGTISLVHWGIDTEKNAADKEEATARYAQVFTVIQRLYAAVKSSERTLGTNQLTAVPAIRLNYDMSINAAANWTTNTIQVNRGLFRLTDQAGDKGQDVLAATLAHELSHIFYRHPGYGSSTQGAKGLFDELRGVTALDRVQEKEADILGIRVACIAGYDPQGMLILMQVFAKLDGSAGSFMKNHPAGIERFNYLQGEVSRCTSFQTRQSPPPNEASSIPTAPVVSAQPSTQGMWKLVQNPNSRWTFKFGNQFLYGEYAYPEERRTLGDFNTVDVKKQGDSYIGTQRERVTFKVKDASPQGFQYKVCQWTFAVELTAVTNERIEGRWEGYQPGSRVNPLTCERSGERIWEEVTWIRE